MAHLCCFARFVATFCVACFTADDGGNIIAAVVVVVVVGLWDSEGDEVFMDGVGAVNAKTVSSVERRISKCSAAAMKVVICFVISQDV